MIIIEGNPNRPQSPKIGVTVDELQGEAGPQPSPEMPPPNLEGYGLAPRKKTLTEIVKEGFARYDAQIHSITGRLTVTVTQMAEAVTRLDRQIGVLNQEMPGKK
jgi:hypothetical protein